MTPFCEVNRVLGSGGGGGLNIGWVFMGDWVFLQGDSFLYKLSTRTNSQHAATTKHSNAGIHSLT
jgi:hypothetical protein